MRRARTRRGIVVSVAATATVLSMAGTGLERGDPPSVVAGGSLVAFVFLWWLYWGIVAFARVVWESSSRPATPSFARAVQSRGARTQLRHDPNAGFLHDRGFMFRRRHWFVGTGCPPVEIPPDHYERLLAVQVDRPVEVARLAPRTWWLFEGEVYWENEGYESDDVKALIRQRERQKQRKLEHARAAMVAEESGSRRAREGIPQDVRMSVWKRDAGRCVECGRSELLEFDHVIPLALGGSNTANNLQLLCADCNRAKGGAL